MTNSLHPTWMIRKENKNSFYENFKNSLEYIKITSLTYIANIKFKEQDLLNMEKDSLRKKEYYKKVIELLHKSYAAYHFSCYEYRKEKEMGSKRGELRKTERARLKQLVKAYTEVGANKKKGERIMIIINKIRKKRDVNLEPLKQKIEENSKTYNKCVELANKRVQIEKCNRCENLGMMRYWHVDHGMCYLCGRYPKIPNY